MSLRTGDHRGSGRVAAVLTTVGALVAFQAVAIVVAGSALATGTCTYNPATDTINITIDSGTGSAVSVDETTGAIEFDGSACGSATNSNTVSIVVLGQPSSNEAFEINENDEVPFNTAIAWSVDLGTGTGDQLSFDLNGDQDNTIVLTDTTFDLNGATGDVLGNENSFVEGSDGDDVEDASVVTYHVQLHGHNGDDVLSPGTFDGDEALGGFDTDTLSYATRTTCLAIINNVDAGLDANCDGDNDDTGDEEDIIDCFENVVAGSGDDFIDDDNCGFATIVPGGGDDVVDGSFSTIDWSTSTGGMTIDIPNETATGQGTDTWTDVFDFIGSEFDDTMLVDDNAPGPGVDGFSGLGGSDTVDATQATFGVFVDLDGLDPDQDDLENAIGSAFDDGLFGNELDNVLTGNGGDDELEGQGGRDTLDGGPGNDELFGDDGNDLLIGGPGDDFFAGNAGADTVSFATNTTAGVVVDLSLFFATSPDSGDDDFGDVLEEIIIGSPFNDQITGGPLGDGGTQNFLMKGGAGKDVLTGFAGNDTLKGGGGKDTLRGVAGDDNLAGGGADDLLVGGPGFDFGKGGKGLDVCKSVEKKKSCGSQKNPKAPQSAVGKRD